MASYKRIRLVVPALLLMLPAVISADSLCTLCITIYRAPGGSDSGQIGLYRFQGCPCCKPEDCKTAAQRAQGLRDRYKTLREQFEKLNQEIADLRSGGQQVSNSKLREQAKLNFALGQLELQYAILNADCPKEVPGDNVWDGLYAGPVENSPVSSADDGGRGCRAAAKAAGTYEELWQSDQQKLEIITGFLNTAADGFSPPASGYDGERAKATRSYRNIGGAYRKAAQNLTKGGGNPNPKANLANPITLTFPEIKVAKDGKDYIRNAGIAVRARLEGNAYILAYLNAHEMYLQSVAAGNKDAAKAHARSTVEFAWQAQGYSKWAADHQHKSDVVHQKLLDDSLAAASKKGLTLGELLKKFQTQVKESGVPAHLRDALTAAGATTEELAGVKERLLALTPEAVEAVLKERRAQIARGAHAPDELVIETQLMASRQAFHKEFKK